MFKVKLQGIGAVKAAFASASKNLVYVVDSELDAMSTEWVTGAKRDAPVDQGRLKNAISKYRAGELKYEIVAQVFYAPFMEFGTKGKYKPIPGTEQIAAQFKGYKGGDFMELLRMIVRWVKRKGITGRYSVKTRKRVGSKIDQLAEDYAAAWPIAVSILKKGISPHPFFFKQQHDVWPRMIQRITRRMANIQKQGNVDNPTFRKVA
jgi:hypothetical protein